MVLEDKVLITVDEQVVARQTPEAQGLLRTVMALVAPILETLRQLRITLAEWRGTLKSQKLEIEQLRRPALNKELAASHGGRTILSVSNTTRTGLSVLLANSVIKALRRLTYGTQHETGCRFVETVHDHP